MNIHEGGQPSVTPGGGESNAGVVRKGVEPRTAPLPDSFKSNKAFFQSLADSARAKNLEAHAKDGSKFTETRNTVLGLSGQQTLRAVNQVAKETGGTTNEVYKQVLAQRPVKSLAEQRAALQEKSGKSQASARPTPLQLQESEGQVSTAMKRELKKAVVDYETRSAPASPPPTISEGILARKTILMKEKDQLSAQIRGLTESDTKEKANLQRKLDDTVQKLAALPAMGSKLSTTAKTISAGSKQAEVPAGAERTPQGLTPSTESPAAELKGEPPLGPPEKDKEELEGTSQGPAPSAQEQIEVAQASAAPIAPKEKAPEGSGKAAMMEEVPVLNAGHATVETPTTRMSQEPAVSALADNDKKSAVRNEVNRQIAELKGDNKVLGREGPLTGIAITHNKSKNTFVATLTFTTALGTKKNEDLVLKAEDLPDDASEVDIIPVLQKQVNKMPVIMPAAENVRFLEKKYTHKKSDETEVLLVGGTRRCTAKQHELFEKHAVNLLKEGNVVIKTKFGLREFGKLKAEKRELTEIKDRLYASGKWTGSDNQKRLVEINEKLKDFTQYDILGKIEEGLEANKLSVDATVESHLSALQVIGSLRLKLKDGQNLSELCQKTIKQTQEANAKFNEFKKAITPEELLTLLVADKSSKEWTNGAFRIEGSDFAQLFEGAQNAVTGIATPFITNIYKAIQADVNANAILSQLKWDKRGGGVLNDNEIEQNKKIFHQYGETCNPKLTSEQIESLSRKHTQLIMDYSTRSEKVEQFAKAIEQFYNEFSP